MAEFRAAFDSDLDNSIFRDDLKVACQRLDRQVRVLRKLEYRGILLEIRTADSRLKDLTMCSIDMKCMWLFRRLTEPPNR